MRSAQSNKPKQREPARWVWVAALGMGSLAAILIWRHPAPPQVPAPSTVPDRVSQFQHPQLTNVHPAVAAHIEESRAGLERAHAGRETPPARAQAWEALGKVYFAYEFAAAAAGCFSNAVALAPAVPQAWFALAEARYELGQFEAARAAMAEARRFETASNGASPTWQRDLLSFLGDVEEKLAQTDAARGYFAEALKLAPEDLYATVKAGQLAAQAGDLAAAANLLETAIKAAPQRREVLGMLAQTYRRLGQNDRADELSRALAHVDPTRKSPELARSSQWRREVRSLSRSPITLHSAGVAAMNSGLYRRATQFFEAALRVDPTNHATRASMAFCHLAQGQAVRAGEIFLAVLREDPANEASRTGLALSLARTGRAAEATQFCSLWQKEQPNNPVPIRTGAEVHMIARDYANAEAAYARFSATDPSNSFAAIGLASARAAQGRHEDARNTLEQALERMAGRSEILHTLARLLATSANPRVRAPKRAVEILKQISHADSLVTLSETHALALAADGDWEAAQTLFQSIERRSSELGDTDAARRIRQIAATLAKRQPFFEPWPFADTLEGAPSQQQPRSE